MLQLAWLRHNTFPKCQRIFVLTLYNIFFLQVWSTDCRLPRARCPHWQGDSRCYQAARHCLWITRSLWDQKQEWDWDWNIDRNVKFCFSPHTNDLVIIDIIYLGLHIYIYKALIFFTLSSCSLTGDISGTLIPGIIKIENMNIMFTFRQPNKL